MTDLLAELLYLAPAFALAGAVTGILAGLFGVGGGALLVPVLYELFRIMQVPADLVMPLCVGTSLAVIIPTSVRSYRAHKAKGAVDNDVLRVWWLPTLIGVLAGAAIAGFAPAELFKLVFIGVALANATKLLFGRDSWRIAGDLPKGALMRAYGMIIGLLSSLMGIGGGAITNMIMTLHGRSIHQAVATAAGLGVVISIPGAIGYMIAGWAQMDALPVFSVGFVSLVGVALLVPASYATAPIGVRIAHSWPKRRLEIAFGLFLLLAASRFVYALVTGG